ncbi:DDB1- and CUL4-associated factor 1-like isoform X3 [Varroa destructor]|uniref:DDB1- and CUL4-associated factor 1 n=1 Tax=Varroa destructor TaxID=109461 RepID=A0A7M7J6L6_VARDE|nr:DDB1- and CUL4-associated factor 1-like isoform X3 [Varroa destructor]
MVVRKLEATARVVKKKTLHSINNQQRQAQATTHRRQTSPADKKGALRSSQPTSTPTSLTVRSGLLADCSNSSWAEMELLTIGHYQIYPLSVEMRQRFILQYLTKLGEYQEFLSFIFEKNVLQLILRYINLKENHDVRLAFEALCYLASLMCHKKFSMEFLKAGGVQRLLEVYRPSVAATGVSICLYYLGYSEDAMEKLCQQPPDVLTELIRYALWLLERSHDSSKCHAIMFLGMAFTYPKFLEYFDAEDGLRRLVNVVSTLDAITNPSINDERHDCENEDKHFASMQTARHVCHSLKKYFEAQLVITAEKLRRGADGAHRDHLLGSKALRLKPEELEETMDFVLNNLPAKSKWHAVDEFISLGGVQLMLKLIMITQEDAGHAGGKTETVRSALEVVGICTLTPRSQMVLTEVIENPNPELDMEDQQEPNGMGLILDILDCDSHGFHSESADLQKAALQIIHNCVGGPVRRPSGATQGTPIQNHSLVNMNGDVPGSGPSSQAQTNSAQGPTNSASGSKSRGSKSGEGTVLHRMWRCLRSHNGIMVLLGRLAVKVPITGADAIRMMACKALCGLARCPTVQQIMSKLPLFTRGHLETLTKEPVLHDHSALHAKFCTYASRLAELVTGTALSRGGNSDLPVARRGDACLVAPVADIKYKTSDLLILMYEHMLGAGLTESANALLKEARLQEALNTRRQQMTGRDVGVVAHRRGVNREISRAGQALSPQPPLTNVPVTPQSKTIPLNRSRADSAGLTPITPIGRRSLKSLTLVEKSEQRDVLSPVIRKNVASIAENALSLDSIVREYLGVQHANCRMPVATCPPFQLLAKHRCEEPILKMRAPFNVTQRLSRRQTDWPWGGRYGARMTRKFIYSKFKPVRTFREPEMPANFTCCSFSACNEMLFVGTGNGELKVFNVHTGTDEATYNCHDTDLTHCQSSKDGTLILTSSFFREPLSVLWTFTDLFQQKVSFKDDSYVEFGKLSDERILGTQYGIARLYDTSTGRKISQFVDQKLANQYIKNRATLNPTDELVLNDGVLWDVRRSQPVHKFDKFNPYLNGVFAPNGLEVIANTEVWDLRTFKLLHTLSALNQCQVLFNARGDVIYGAMVVCEDMDQERDQQLQNMFGNSFKTIDATDYSNIATIDIKRRICDIKTDGRDMYLAIVENAGERTQMGTDSVVRLYEVGRQKLEDDVDDNEQDDDDVDDDDDEASSSSASDDLFNDTVDIDDPAGFSPMEDDEDDEEGSFADTEGSSAGGEDDSEDEGWVVTTN